MLDPVQFPFYPAGLPRVWLQADSTGYQNPCSSVIFVVSLARNMIKYLHGAYTNHRLNGNHCCLCFPWSPLLSSISHHERKKGHHCCRRISLHQSCCHHISLHQGYDSVFSATRCKKLRWQEMSSSG